MSKETDVRALETQNELSKQGLERVTADVDSSNTCYLSGEVDTRDESAQAVAIAYAEGASHVRDGLVTPANAASEAGSDAAAGDSTRDDAPARTAAQRILGGADVSDRLFDSPTSGLQDGDSTRHGGVR